jgi:hypothetical protein
VNLQINRSKFIASIDEMFSTFCPSILFRRLSRIESPDEHWADGAYNSDRLFFGVCKQRTFLRQAFYGEFDHSPAKYLPPKSFCVIDLSFKVPNELMTPLLEYVPRLWVQVSQHSNGTHQVSAIYRGEPKWAVRDWVCGYASDFKTDGELTEALKVIQAREGLDEVAFKRFYEKYKEAALLDAAIVPNNCGVAN